MWANDPEMAEEWEEEEKNESRSMRITRRQLRKIVREAINDQLPYRAGQPWSDLDAPVGRDDEYIDPLDRELTDEEMDAAGYFEEEGWPLTIGYTDENGEDVEFVVHNEEESEHFFSLFFKKYGMRHPYSVD